MKKYAFFACFCFKLSTFHVKWTFLAGRHKGSKNEFFEERGFSLKSEKKLFSFGECSLNRLFSFEECEFNKKLKKPVDFNREKNSEQCPIGSSVETCLTQSSKEGTYVLRASIAEALSIRNAPFHFYRPKRIRRSLICSDYLSVCLKIENNFCRSRGNFI